MRISPSDSEHLGDKASTFDQFLWNLFCQSERRLYIDGVFKSLKAFQCRFHSREQAKIGWSQVRRVRGNAPGVVTLFFSKKTLTKTDRCAGALSWRRNRLLFLHFSGHFLLTSSIRRRTNLWDWNTPKQQFLKIIQWNPGNFLKALVLIPVYHTRRYHIFCHFVK